MHIPIKSIYNHAMLHALYVAIANKIEVQQMIYEKWHHYKNSVGHFENGQLSACTLHILYDAHTQSHWLVPNKQAKQVTKTDLSDAPAHKWALK